MASALESLGWSPGLTAGRRPLFDDDLPFIPPETDEFAEMRERIRAAQAEAEAAYGSEPELERIAIPEHKKERKWKAPTLKALDMAYALSTLLENRKRRKRGVDVEQVRPGGFYAALEERRRRQQEEIDKAIAENREIGNRERELRARRQNTILNSVIPYALRDPKGSKLSQDVEALRGMPEFQSLSPEEQQDAVLRIVGAEGRTPRTPASVEEWNFLEESGMLPTDPAERSKIGLQHFVGGGTGGGRDPYQSAFDSTRGRLAATEQFGQDPAQERAQWVNKRYLQLLNSVNPLTGLPSGIPAPEALKRATEEYDALQESLGAAAEDGAENVDQFFSLRGYGDDEVEKIVGPEVAGAFPGIGPTVAGVGRVMGRGGLPPGTELRLPNQTPMQPWEDPRLGPGLGRMGFGAPGAPPAQPMPQPPGQLPPAPAPPSAAPVTPRKLSPPELQKALLNFRRWSKMGQAPDPMTGQMVPISPEQLREQFMELYGIDPFVLEGRAPTPGGP